MEDITTKTPLRMLHLEDNPQDRQLVEEKLAAGGFRRIRRVGTEARPLLAAIQSTADAVNRAHHGHSH